MANTYNKQNHLKKLREFCQAAKLGRMTKAAASLFTSQPTISLQIQALEEGMDTRLFERCGPKVTLEAGGWEVIKRYVSLGQGISIVTDVCITEDDRTKLKVIPIGRYFPQRSYGIVTRNGKFLSAPSQRLIEILNQCFVVDRRNSE